jgi:HEAT repeat protein
VDKDYTPVFIPLLRDADVKVRLEAGEGLRKIGPGAKAAIPGLTIALKDSSVKMRLSSAWAIWRIDLQTNALSTAINEAVQSSQSSWCYEFCGRCLDEAHPADRAFIPVLTNILGGSNANARVMAARILGKYDLYGREAIPALAKAAENGDPGLRNAALSSLKRIDPEAAAKYQLTLTQTESP